MTRLFSLVLISVLLSACGGGSDPSPEPTGGTATETPSTPGETASGDAIEVEAEDLVFDTSTISATAGASVNVELKNQDAVPHNISFYTDSSAGEEIFVGDTITGPDAETTYTFDAPAEAGDYYFRCDVHPNMNGTFTVS